MDCKKRLFKVLVWAGAALAAVLAYAALARGLGYGIPCVFHALTGLLCPGCGVTRMGTCLLQGDILGAFFQNPVVFVLLPVAGAVALIHLTRYVKTGERKTPKWEERCWITLAAVLVLWGVARNVALMV